VGSSVVTNFQRIAVREKERLDGEDSDISDGDGMSGISTLLELGDRITSLWSTGVFMKFVKGDSGALDCIQWTESDGTINEIEI